MKDMLGTEVEVGDITLSCAATSRGLAKLGRVYALNRNGYPLVEYRGVRFNYKTSKYEEGWMKGEAGSHVLIVGRERLGEMQVTPELIQRIREDYPSAS